MKNIGIYPTPQRVKILEYLRSTKEHPTADIIYEKLKKELPYLSKTTVYNTLKLFKEKGIIQELTIDPEERRFDGNPEPHVHFKCLKCGKVFDIKDEIKIQKKEKIEGHIIKEVHLYLKGICKNCQK